MKIQYYGSGVIPSYVGMIYEGEKHSNAFLPQKMKETFVLEIASSHKDKRLTTSRQIFFLGRACMGYTETDFFHLFFITMKQ